MIEGLTFALAAFLCGIGILVSALAFSGTWIVLAAALITFFTSGVPSIGTLIAFVLICIGTEIVEAVAGWLGVQKRGGSKFAGLAALIGGLVGAVIGSGIFPIIGTFFGMLAGSFALAFLIEWNRLQHHGKAAAIAFGAVWARLAVMLLKTALTVAMTVWLLVGLLR